MRRSVLAVLLLLSACAPQDDVVMSHKDQQKLDFAVPAVLTNKIDLNNPEVVAKALGIRLNGDRKQHLYDIHMSGVSSERKRVDRIIPIRVDNIKQGSEIIYSIEGSNYVPPAKNKVAKPSVKKVTKK